MRTSPAPSLIVVPEAGSPNAVHPPRTAFLGANSTALLDALRAAAANLVLFGHAADVFRIKTAFPAGLMGVGVFFILSGFLILQSSMARISRPGPYFLPYLVDRFARIFTAYLPVLTLVAGVNALVDLGRWGQDGTSTGPAAFTGNMLLLQDYPVFQIGRRLAGNTLFIRPYNTAEPFWTIPIEFWIYVVFGLGFFGLAMRERIGWALFCVLGLVAVPVVVWNAAAGGGNGLSLVWLAGAAAGYFWVSAWHRSGHKMQVGLTMLAAGCVCLVGRGLKLGWNFQDIGMALCEAVMLLGALSVMEAMGDLPRALRRACTVLASYSYTLYLVHNTVLIVARHGLLDLLGSAALPAALVASHAVAFACYILFERHYRLVGRLLKRLIQPGGMRPVSA